MQEQHFNGVWTALITPFLEDESIDWTSYDHLLSRQAEANVTGVVISGTTGESPCLSEQEKLKLIEHARSTLPDHIRIMAGTGSNSTRASIELSKKAQEAGADSLLVVTPPYNKPTPSGLYRHFSEIAAATELPICLYHVPGRTAQTLAPETMKKLTDIPSIQAVKEASGDLALFGQFLEISEDSLCYLTGDDPTFLASFAIGCEGVISVLSNLYPKAMKLLFDLSKTGHHTKALALNKALTPLFHGMFIESNPGPVKAAFASKGLCQNILRSPLAPMEEQNQQSLLALIKDTEQKLAGLEVPRA